MAIDALVPCVTRSSAAMVLTVQIKNVLIFYEERGWNISEELGQ